MSDLNESTSLSYVTKVWLSTVFISPILIVLLDRQWLEALPIIWIFGLIISLPVFGLIWLTWLFLLHRYIKTKRSFRIVITFSFLIGQQLTFFEMFNYELGWISICYLVVIVSAGVFFPIKQIQNA